MISTFATRSVEDVCAAGAAVWFQLYPLRDRGATRELVTRATAAGARAIVLTADMPVLGKRESDISVPLRLPPGVRYAHLPESMDTVHVQDTLQAQLDLRRRPVAHCGERADPEDLPHDGRVLHEGLLLARERVQAGGDDALDRLRERQVGVGTRLGQHADEFLRVERVAARMRQQLIDARLRDRALGEERPGLQHRERRSRAFVWVGFPFVVAGAGLAVGLEGRRGSRRVEAGAAVVIGGLALVLGAVAYAVAAVS